MTRDEHSTHWRWQSPSFVSAREPEHTPRMLLSSTPWLPTVLGQSGAPRVHRPEVRSLSWGVWTCSARPRDSNLAWQKAHRYGAPRVTVDSTHGGRSHPAPPHVGGGPRLLRASQATSGLGGARAYPPHAAARSATARDCVGCPSMLSYVRESHGWSVWGLDTARPLALLQPRVGHGRPRERRSGLPA
jgi:hypothetical protein